MRYISDLLRSLRSLPALDFAAFENDDGACMRESAHSTKRTCLQSERSRNIWRCIVTFCAACLSPEMVVAEPVAPSPSEVLATLNRSHPRLLATDADFAKLKSLASAGEAGKWFASLKKSADKLLTAEPSKYEIPDGKRLLATSRRVLDRTLLLGLTFRLTSEVKYSERLWKELEAASKFKDWNPSHYLDTAEMTAALAIGYDWLFATWTATQRAAIKKAIVEMGLNQSLELYRKKKGWTMVNHNWNQVCNGGMSLGALALADEEPALAGEILSAAISSVPRAMNEFAPDGAWGEGPGYWDYAVMYNVFMLAALDSALEKDFGLSKIDGFSKAADFPIQVSGPLGRTFNYADAGDSGAGGSHILWLANKFSRPDFAAWRLQKAAAKPSPLDFLWGTKWLEQPNKLVAPPLAKHFRGPEVVTMRSSWSDPNATFVGFKAGDNKVNHGHLDVGTFVLDAEGERWAIDLGGDDYNLKGYFGKQRWDYYRLRAEGHNTLVIAPDGQPDQDPKAETKITRFAQTNDGAWAVADLSAAYTRQAKSVGRGIRMAGREVLLQDEIQTNAPCDVWWFMHSGAVVTCKGNTAVLTQNGKKLTATLLSPAGAIFEVRPVVPLPSSPQPAVQQVKHSSVKSPQKLAVHCSGTDAVRIVVLLSPGEAVSKPTIIPLAKWK